MKNLIYLALAFFIISAGKVFAQTAPQPTFESLQMNSSPAYILLGVEPSNIQRPTTPSQFVAGLQNAVVNGKLQPNVAFEITPYQYQNPKDTTSRLFYASDYLLNKKNVLQTIWQTFSISLATSATDTTVFGKLKPGTGAGVGFHFLLLDGSPGDRFKAWADEYLQFLFIKKIKAMVTNSSAVNIDNIDLVLDNAENDYVQYVLPKINFNTLSTKQVKAFIAAYRARIVANLQLSANGKDRATIQKCLESLYNDEKTKLETVTNALNQGVNPLAKEGFTLEFDAGQAYAFPDDNYSDMTLAKSAVWLSPSYRWDLSKGANAISLLDLDGVMRYTFNNTSVGVDVANYFDAGLKGELTQNKWAGSLEYVYRHASAIPVGYSKDYTYRLTAGLSYKLSDMITFTFNFGTNFDGNTTTYSDPKKMFAIGGLNLGFLNLGSTKN